MTTGDLINAFFEGFAGFAVLNHCRALLKDKKVHGVSVASTVFFTSWGFWNMYYYPSLGQHFSFYAGFIVCSANCLWVFLMLKYRGNK